jgi:hypothetical protein
LFIGDRCSPLRLALRISFKYNLHHEDIDWKNEVEGGASMGKGFAIAIGPTTVIANKILLEGCCPSNQSLLPVLA